MNPGRRKVEDSDGCLLCGAPPSACAAAHLWPRSKGESGFENTDLIVPLCEEIKGGVGCHQDFDAGDVDVLGHLTEAEELAVVRAARNWNGPNSSGIEGAYRRLAPTAARHG